MNKHGISFIVPCYNPGNYILELVNSIENQRLNIPYEINITNDGSTSPDTLSALDKLAKHKHVNIYSNGDNKGAQVARNLSLSKAQYDYILPIDSDDKLNTNSEILIDGSFPERAIDILSKNEDVAFVHCSTQMFGEFNGYTRSPYPLSEELVINKHHVPTWIVYRRVDANFAGGYNEEIMKWQDWSFGVGLLNGRYQRKLLNNIVYLPKPYVMYRNYSDDSRVSFKQVDELSMVRLTVDKYLPIFRKYYANLPSEQIAKNVLSNKPDALIDLLYVAQNDIELAKEIVAQRGFALTNKDVPKNTP